MGKIRNIKVLRRELINGTLGEYSYSITKDDGSTNIVHFKRPATINGQMTAKNVFRIAGAVSDDFVKGFKLLADQEGRYLYYQQGNGLRPEKIIPYIFDIATDFNEYGLAMVAVNGRVSWMNQDFQYVDKDNMLQSYDEDMEDAWASVSSFSEGTIPLSKLMHPGEGLVTAYMCIDTSIKCFRRFENGKIVAGPISSNHFDMNSTDFNRDGWAFAEDRVLCDQGFYMKNEFIAKEAIAKGFVKTICENPLKN